MSSSDRNLVADAKEGGLYVSEDKGVTWKRASSDKRIWERNVSLLSPLAGVPTLGREHRLETALDQAGPVHSELPGKNI